MKMHYIVCISLIFAGIINANPHVAPYFNNRSQGRNAARDWAGWTNYINAYCDPHSVYGAVAATPEYTQSFSPHHITKPLFGNNLINGTSELAISGTQTTNRNPHDLLADYFYLPPDFKSTVQFAPTIDNFLIDFSWYLGLDAWKPGLYLWIHGPLVHTRWNLAITENVIDSGIVGYAPGYYAPSAIPRSSLLDQFIDYTIGDSISDVGDVIFEELKYAKMSNTKRIKTRIAEVRLLFGRNFVMEDKYHAGLNIQIAIPAGLRPVGEFLFEPMVGNGDHWELGFGTNGHYELWNNETTVQRAQLYADINLTHLFKTRQRRTFDLVTNGPLSRYMIAMEMSSPAVNLAGGGVVPSGQFDNKFLPVANITTRDVNVTVALQADIVFMFNLTSRGLNFDLGYNYWAVTREKITLNPQDSFATNSFALKGDSQIFGFIINSSTAVALSATQDTATINAGKNIPAQGTTDPATIAQAQHNPNIDFPQPATTNPQPSQPLMFAPNNNNFPADQIQTSVNPVFLSQSDIDLDGARTCGSSSKLFTHLSYTWFDRVDWQPYVGIGGEIEFAHSKSYATSSSQWGIWLKGGATF